MNLILMPTNLKGKIKLPDSVPLSHRLMVISAIHGGCTIKMRNMSNELQKTERALRDLVEYAEFIDVGHSQETFAFLLPLILITRGGGLFKGDFFMMKKMLSPIKSTLLKHGALVFPPEKKQILRLGGTLTPGTYYFKSDVHPSVPSGFLAALSAFNDDSDLILQDDKKDKNFFETRYNLELTMSALKTFNVRTLQSGNRIHVFANRNRFRKSKVISPEKDWYLGALWFAAATLGQNISCPELPKTSAQRGQKLVEFAENLALQNSNEVTVLNAFELGNILPFALLIAATTTKSITDVINVVPTEKLAIATVDMLKNIGAKIETHSGKIRIIGKKYLEGGTVETRGFPEIAAASAIAAVICTNPIKLLDAEAVQKKYPHFFAEYKKAGGNVFPV